MSAILVLLELADFPLPEQLMSNLIAGKALVLETVDNLAIYYYLPNSNTGLNVNQSQYQ